MLIAIDIGNTNIKFAVCINNKIIKTIRISSQQTRTADEYLFILSLNMKLLNIDYNNISSIIISSVVPRITQPIIELSKKHFNIEPIILNSQHASIFNIKIDVQNKVIGSDRLADIIAASYLYPNKDLLIIGMGTVTVFNLCNKHKSIYGQVIAPGAQILAKSIRQYTALLPEVLISKQTKIVHDSTYYSIESGIYWGYITMVEGIIQKIIKEEKKNLYIIATGGNSHLFSEYKIPINIIESDLTIKGLIHLHQVLHSKNL